MLNYQRVTNCKTNQKGHSMDPMRTQVKGSPIPSPVEQLADSRYSGLNGDFMGFRADFMGFSLDVTGNFNEI